MKNLVPLNRIARSALAIALGSLPFLTPSVAAVGSSRPPGLRFADAKLPALTVIPPGAGSHGFPYDAVPAKPTFPGAPTINLSVRGYVEREFKMTGTTNIYRQSGFWGSDGRWDVSVSQSNVPYTTRLLVRYPTNPSKFNGTVVVEWLNDTTGGDQDPVWSEIYREVLSQGYAYVGVTAQTPGSRSSGRRWSGSPTTVTCGRGNWLAPRTLTSTRGLYEGATIQREEPLVTAPNCVFGVPLNGATLPDNMGVYELEDAALAALRKWILPGVQPPHGNPIATSPFFNLVERDQYRNALGGIRLPDISVSTPTYSAINFSKPSQESLSPSQLLSTLESIFTALETGEITNATLRGEGLCLLEGFYTPFTSSTLRALYPTHANYVSAFTAAATRDLAAGFLTPSDYRAAVTAAKASSVP